MRCSESIVDRSVSSSPVSRPASPSPLPHLEHQKHTKTNNSKERKRRDDSAREDNEKEKKERWIWPHRLDVVPQLSAPPCPEWLPPVRCCCCCSSSQSHTHTNTPRAISRLSNSLHEAFLAHGLSDGNSILLSITSPCVVECMYVVCVWVSACCCAGALPSVSRTVSRPRLLRVLSHMWSFRLEVSVYKSIITGEGAPASGNCTVVSGLAACKGCLCCDDDASGYAGCVASLGWPSDGVLRF